MRLKHLWRGAALVVLGTTAGFLAFDYVDQHPEAAATAMAGLSRYPRAALNLLVGGQAEQNGTGAAQSNDPKPDVAADSTPAEEASEPVKGPACNDPARKTEIFQLHNIEASAVAKLLVDFLNEMCAPMGDSAPNPVAIRIVPESNKLIVSGSPGSGSPADECYSLMHLIEQIDVPPMRPADKATMRQVQIFALRNFLAADAAKAIQKYIYDLYTIFPINGFAKTWDVVCVADPITNSVICSVASGNDDEMLKVAAALIAEIDVAPK